MKNIFNKSLMAAAALMIVSSTVKCQPYYTNTSQGYGVQQYNNNYTQPLQPSKTLAQQYQAGILAGSIPPAPWFLLTNPFSTNIYTTAPVVTANAVGTFSQSVCSTNEICVLSSTTTNFILQTAVTNITVNWQAVGH